MTDKLNALLFWLSATGWVTLILGAILRPLFVPKRKSWKDRTGSFERVYVLR